MLQHVWNMSTEETLERVVDSLGNLTARVSGLAATVSGVATTVSNLAAVVDTVAGTVASRDDQIEALIQIVEKNSAHIAAQGQQIAALERQWQAYINTLPRQ